MRNQEDTRCNCCFPGDRAAIGRPCRSHCCRAAGQTHSERSTCASRTAQCPAGSSRARRGSIRMGTSTGENVRMWTKVPLNYMNDIPRRRTICWGWDPTRWCARRLGSTPADKTSLVGHGMWCIDRTVLRGARGDKVPLTASAPLHSVRLV